MLPEILLSLAAMVFLLSATLSWALPGDRGNRLAWPSTMLALAALTLAIGIRWVEAGHPPVFGTYENGLSAGWIITLLALVFRQWLSPWPPALALIALASLGYGMLHETERIPLTISEQSIWVDIHALLAWLAYGFLSLSFIASLKLVLDQRRGGEAKGEEGARVWDELQNRWLSLGFLYQTALMVTGAYYSSVIFGHWWQWDLAESITLVSWLVYALSIHLRLFRGWKGLPAARLNLFAYGLAIIPYWFLVYFFRNTYHIFDIGLKALH